MKHLDLSIEILNTILDNDISFADALRNKFQSNLEIRPLRAEVAGLVGCEIRHHLLFTYLTKNLENFTVADKRVLALGLANDYFYRHFSREEMDAAVKEKLGEEKYAEAAPLYEVVGKPDEFIPVSIPRNSNTYLSLRYNTPEWLLKIFQHFGYGTTYKTLRAFSKPHVATLRATSAVKEGELGPDFVPTLTEGVYAYKGKIAVRKIPSYREGRIFDERIGVKFLIESHKIEDPATLLLYNGEDKTDWEREVLETYGSSIDLNLACPDIDKKLSVTRAIRAKGLHNVNFYSAPEPMHMDASVTRPCELVICAPKSTNFNDIPTAPDFILHFNKDSMDALFASQKEALEGCAKYVAANGTLIYAIHTLSKKEGQLTISNFLHTHEEFTLDEERQILPFEKEGVALYYAVLRKGEKQLTLGTPLQSLSSLAANSSAPSASAETLK